MTGADDEIAPSLSLPQAGEGKGGGIDLEEVITRGVNMVRHTLSIFAVTALVAAAAITPAAAQCCGCAYTCAPPAQVQIWGVQPGYVVNQGPVYSGPGFYTSPTFEGETLTVDYPGVGYYDPTAGPMTRSGISCTTPIGRTCRRSTVLSGRCIGAPPCRAARSGARIAIVATTIRASGTDRRVQRRGRRSPI
jgi:hypothetical protein